MDSDNSNNRSSELITHKYPRSPASEAFRSLRTNLSFLSPDHPLRSILVTSSEIGDGKSMVITNLAVSLAQNNLKIILIDADIRKPMLHRFFEMTNHTGLSNILTDDAEYDQVLRGTEIENVSLLSTGTIPPNPAELLSSQKMDQVIETSEKRADIVLIDTPPAGIVTDAVILSHKVDGVILVAASQETDKGMIKNAREKLKQAQANVIGTVLNKYPVGKRGYYNSYYYSSG